MYWRGENEKCRTVWYRQTRVFYSASHKVNCFQDIKKRIQVMGI